MKGGKMSKSVGNVVSPDEIIEKFGADTARLFILFAAPPERDLDWNDTAVEGAYRFINRVFRAVDDLREFMKDEKVEQNSLNEAEKKLRLALHSSIKKVTDDFERFSFNTAISSIMEAVNALYQYKESVSAENINGALISEVLTNIVIMLSPFIPHAAQEMWELMGRNENLINVAWPKAASEALVVSEIEIAVQINGKVREKFGISPDMSQDEIKEAVLASEKVKALIGEKQIVKCIVVPKKLVNIVIK